MNTKKLAIAVLAGVLGVAIQAQAQLNLVLNGGFQGGNTGGAPTDWTVDLGTVTAGSMPTAPSGYAADMLANNSFKTSDFYQNITLPTGPEVVSFWVDVPAGGGVLSVNFADANPDLMDTGINAGSGWTKYSFLYTPTDPTVTPTIDFDWNSAGGNNAYIDNVSVTPVPETTTIISGVLTLLPFGASGLRIFRKRQQAA
jgi:hypothetical protein